MGSEFGFELTNAAVKWLSLKSAALLAIATSRRVSELHALSVSPQCLSWEPECKQVTLWPNPGLLPKVLSPQYVKKPIIISAFTDDHRSVLCPVTALQQYVEVTKAWRATDQLFIGTALTAHFLLGNTKGGVCYMQMIKN